MFQQEFKEAVEENDEAHFFELFSSEQIMKPFDLSDEEIENGVLGSGNDGGCDAVFVLHNGVIVTEDMLQELNNSKNAVVDLVVIQAKREISFSEDTIRPIIGDYVSLAKFTLLEDIKLYDLTKKSVPERSTPEDGIPLLFDAIGALFSRPVETKRENYIATQFLAEEIKRMGFDGLRFESSLHRGGFNTVLFELFSYSILCYILGYF